jgi:Putative abortive phage resistance protein AbiGi, antitoxin
VQNRLSTQRYEYQNIKGGEMALSSNSIIHFTKTKENLMGILESNFKPHYCRETICLGDEVRKYLFPMVSFCDIPLSEIKNHINKYGSYGLGLTREWATKQGLNPVLYLDKESVLSKNLDYAFDKLIDEKEGDFENLDKKEKCLYDVIRYVKNYEADLNRGGKINTNYRFSDEREWRYVPNYENDFDMAIGTEFSDDEENKEDVEENKSKLSQLELYFEPNDIKYIVIKSDVEISEFLEILRKAKGKIYSYHDVERLMTRILTTEQIMTDM